MVRVGVRVRARVTIRVSVSVRVRVMFRVTVMLRPWFRVGVGTAQVFLRTQRYCMLKNRKPIDVLIFIDWWGVNE